MMVSLRNVDQGWVDQCPAIEIISRRDRKGGSDAAGGVCLARFRLLAASPVYPLTLAALECVNFPREHLISRSLRS